MRNLVRFGTFFVSVLAMSAAACGTGGQTADTPDAANSSGPDAPPGSDLQPPPAGQGFQLRSPDIVIPKGEEHTYCWYTTVTLPAATGVKKWESHMTPGSHHLIVFMTNTATQPDGTLVDGCGLLGGGGVGNLPVWSYSAQVADQSAPMPPNVGMEVAATQHLYVQLHYINETDGPLTVHATINGWTYAATDTYMKAAAFVTYDTGINIPAGVGQTYDTGKVQCSNTPVGVQFFAMSTHSHRRSVETMVYDNGTQILDSTDWQHPTIKNFATDAPTWDFYSFKGQLSYECKYVNDLTTAVHTGDSAATNEMCMAVGYFFPADGGPVFCLN
jgi:hypothetical protein